MLTINLLQALPKTPLWDRLKRDGRLDEDQTRESNVRFLRPYDEVVAAWRRSIAYANDPERLFERFRYQVDATYVNRKTVSATGKLTWANLSGAAVMIFRVLIHLGILADYRRPFWRAAKHALSRGAVDGLLGMAFMSYHLIAFTREALRGEQNASFYLAGPQRGRPARVGRSGQAAQIRVTPDRSSTIRVVPAKAGTHSPQPIDRARRMVPRFRGDDHRVWASAA